jgi:hypothetical protein
VVAQAVEEQVEQPAGLVTLFGVPRRWQVSIGTLAG